MKQQNKTSTLKEEIRKELDKHIELNTADFIELALDLAIRKTQEADKEEFKDFKQRAYMYHDDWRKLIYENKLCEIQIQELQSKIKELEEKLDFQERIWEVSIAKGKRK